MRRLSIPLWSLAALLVLNPQAKAAEPGKPVPFLQAKTCFQTNSNYDPRLAIAVDAVIVHRHGEATKALTEAIGSWKRKGYTVGRMFFADSDAINVYWTGKWDGTPHPEDVEINAAGQKVLCAGIRPYMLPTEGWTRYLEEMTIQSIEAGADAILPEEPLAHVDTGYEKSFQELWGKRYGRPWMPEKASPEARFLTAQLKNELYAALEARLAEVTRQKAREAGREVAFVLPIHSLYSNVASKLVAPLGTSLPIAESDGYIGQVWTGPVNWALAHYDSPEKTFFTSAYALYDYFVELTVASRKRLWLLGDPVEDDPNHTWAEFEGWYRHCLAAKLMFPQTAQYEVMPWPDRIFLPGFSTGGQTPAPESYRIVLLSAVQVLQEVPADGEWIPAGNAPTEGVGVAVADTVLWEKEPAPKLQATYGLLLPLINQGVPVSACILERSGDPHYMSRFHTLVLSYEAFKPTDPKIHTNLAAWVRRGGVLILLGEPETLKGDFWWVKEGFESPLHHLAAQLGVDVQTEGEQALGRGRVYRRLISPRRFGDPAIARAEYLPLVSQAVRQSGTADALNAPGYFCLRRGPFLIAHAARGPLTLPGKLVDVLNADLPIRDGVTLQPGESGVYRDVSEALDADGGRNARPSQRGRRVSLRFRRPHVMHATHRLMSEAFNGTVLRFVIRGPAETPAVARLFVGNRLPKEIIAHDATGKPVAVESDLQLSTTQPKAQTQPAAGENQTIRVKFPNEPDGVTVEVRW
ncbi:MAG TPA: hypothetical protein PKG54_07755 [Phycisphaerae bacterium]|jgi:hypothetical protein|nr:hypothetical protein [Phycisphaerae bacterium]HOB74405.1 hypothetical protein [Phycisphaerae bacterium]HOJ54476.1 hypothetical protein [Phycisphaerae bacterium]HOL26505.1 hypothetical protein [Phycisphaerae bacterium]HPP20904.1 hypothetical protein [Phycisphaerae bacterium]